MTHDEAMNIIMKKSRNKNLYKRLINYDESLSPIENAYKLGIAISNMRHFIYINHLKFANRNPLYWKPYNKRGGAIKAKKRLKLWDSSLTLKQNAKKLGISMSYVSHFCNNHQLPYTKKYKSGISLVVTPMSRQLEARNKILALRKEGLTLGQIGKIYGVTQERIRQLES